MIHPAPIMPNTRTKRAIIRGSTVPAIHHPGDVVRLLVDASTEAHALDLDDITRSLDALTRRLEHVALVAKGGE